MALFHFAKRLQKSLVIFPLLHSISQPPPWWGQLYSSYSAFHQPRRVHFESRPHFSTLQRLSTRTFIDPFEFPEKCKIQACNHRAQNLLQLLKQVSDFPSEAEALVSLDKSGIGANQDLIYSVIWALREEWRIAFLAFKWGEKWRCVDDKACELMVWVLGSHTKFNVAWCLIRDFHLTSLGVTRRAILIMIDRYAGANHPDKAIRTFHIMEKFRLRSDEEAFHCLLKSLCKNGNIEEAEEFMFINKTLFPLNTESFNIILSGWCNILVDVVEAKRVWREMSRCCITPNATSYTLMISCFSKVSNLFDSLRLYTEMKRRGWAPGFEIYNSLIYVLTRQNCLREALKVLDKMKEEGVQPDSATYNAMISPLCEAKRVEEARNILAAMVGEKLTPTIETYHAFLEGADFEGTLEVLDLMRSAGLGPNGETFFLILGKFLASEKPENALKLWLEMKRYEVIPDLTHYTLLIEGLAKYGLLIKAREFYSEMKSNGIPDDPKLKKILKEPARGSRDKSKQPVRKTKKAKQVNPGEPMKRKVVNVYQGRKKTSLKESP